MKKELIKTNSITAEELRQNRGLRPEITGDVSEICGDVSEICGDVSEICGDVSGICGDVSGICGNVSGIRGDVDKCELTYEERKHGIPVSELIRKD